MTEMWNISSHFYNIINVSVFCDAEGSDVTRLKTDAEGHMQ